MARLAESTLSRLLPVVRPPLLPRPAPGILHLGIGAFHRAHMAEYTEDAEAIAPGGWGIVGATMRSAEARDALEPQDGLYSLLVRDRHGEQARVLGVLRTVLSVPDDGPAVLAHMAASATRIVSLTVTEKGYALDPASRRLCLDDPRIVADLSPGALPRTALGLLHEAMRRRRDAGLPGFTVLCCDNLPSNGDTVRTAMLAFAEAKRDGLVAWIQANVTFPNSMVDRIVPATTEADRAYIARRIGLDDAAPVITEQFKQWVVEDRFAAGRPAWERVGVEFVSDVAPYELMKLRLLNGSHSAIAYLGALAGLTFVNEVVGHAALRRFIEGLMAESATTVPLRSEDYRAALLARFDNPALGHRCRQIAMDGTQKLPQRLVAPIAARLAEGLPIPHLALAAAAWMRYAAGETATGERYTVDDPLAAQLARLQEAQSIEGRFEALVRLEPVFGKDLPRNPAFVEPVRSAYLDLWRDEAIAVASRVAGR
ncbi:MAG: mannitol dehydrogenase family protein [Alphaproteobacteria bacterium]|nr:mannitol dehydrogenase family protein [Alphaproteobacteria bacterium]